MCIEIKDDSKNKSKNKNNRFILSPFLYLKSETFGIA